MHKLGLCLAALGLAALGLAALGGCGGGGTGGASPPAATAGGAALQAILQRSYTLVDLGRLNYAWPGWLLSPGAGSIPINDGGAILTSVDGTPYTWTPSGLAALSGRFTLARALNNEGQVAGETWPAEFNGFPLHAALWSNGVVTDLGSLDMGPNTYHYSAAFGINDAGQVVGESPVTPPNSNVNPATHAVLYRDGMLHDLGTLGGSYCRAVAINNMGMVIGYGSTAIDLQTHAFSWLGGGIVDLGTLPSGTYSQPTAVNDIGQIVGFASVGLTSLYGSAPTRAVLWQNGSISDLGTLGGPGSFATGINTAGAVVGSAETGELRASEWTNVGYYYDFFTYNGYGWNIRDTFLPGAQNDGGGSGFAGGGNGRSAVHRAIGDERSYYVAHAFLYTNHTMIDLNRVLPIGSPWELTQAHAINARGQITGIGTLHGEVHGFLLSPK